MIGKQQSKVHTAICCGIAVLLLAGGAFADKLTPTVTLTASGSVVPDASTVVFTGRVQGAAGQPVPTGSVSFAGFCFAIPSPLLGTDGSFTYAWTQAQCPSVSVTAHYAGDANYGPATSNSVSVRLDPGLATLTPSPTTVDFSSSAASVTPSPHIVTLTNTGHVAATIDRITSTNPAFAVTPASSCSAVIMSQSVLYMPPYPPIACTVSVSFTPSGVGTQSGSILVYGNLVGSPLAVPVTATALDVPPPVTAVLTSVSPSSVLVGSGDLTVHVYGTGISTSTPIYLFRNAGTSSPYIQLATKWISSTQIDATIPASWLATAATLTITPASSIWTWNSQPLLFSVLPPPVTFTQARYVPHVVTGGGFSTILSISNVSTDPATISVTYYDQKGNTLATDPLMLSPGAAGQSSLPGADRNGPYSVRWAAVRSTASVSVQALVELTDASGRALNTVGYNDAQPLTSQTLPLEMAPPAPLPVTSGATPPDAAPAAIYASAAGNGIAHSLGLAIANPSTIPAAVTLTVVDANGAKLSTEQITLPAWGQTALNLMSDPFLRAAYPDGNFFGSLLITSNMAVSVVAVGDDRGPFYSISTTQR